MQAYSEYTREGNCAQLRVIFSFYASTIVPALDAADRITDPIIAKILPNVQLVRWLKSLEVYNEQCVEFH